MKGTTLKDKFPTTTEQVIPEGCPDLCSHSQGQWPNKEIELFAAKQKDVDLEWRVKSESTGNRADWDMARVFFWFHFLFVLRFVTRQTRGVFYI